MIVDSLAIWSSCHLKRASDFLRERVRRERRALELELALLDALQRQHRVQRIAHETARVAHQLQRLAIGNVEVAAAPHRGKTRQILMVKHAEQQISIHNMHIRK